MDLHEFEGSARGCSPQSVMLDFMTAIVGVSQVKKSKKSTKIHQIKP